MPVVLRFAVLLAAAALAGCAGPTTSELNVTDRSTFIPSARVAVDIAGESGPRSEPHSSHAIELGLSGGRGSDKQDLNSGDRPIVLGSQTFTAPQELRSEFDFRFVELAYRYRRFFGSSRTFGIEGLAGLAYADLGLTVSGATQRASERLGNGGIVVSVGGIWRFRPTTSLQARLAFFGSGKTEGITGANRFDVYVAQALGQHAALRAGFSSWALRSEREGEDNSTSVKSPIQVRFSGPALGLELMF